MNPPPVITMATPREYLQNYELTQVLIMTSLTNQTLWLGNSFAPLFYGYWKSFPLIF